MTAPVATWAVVLGVLVASGAIGATAAELTFDLKVQNGRVPDNMRLIRVHEGDVVTLRWTTDRPMLLHLHGYDIENRVAPGAATDMKFTAYATGRFPIHAHTQAERSGGPTHEDLPLVNVEVYPR
jgi:hypothetical protein